MDTVTAAPGTTATLPLRLTGATASFAGFNAIVRLPRALSLSALRKGSLTSHASFFLTYHELDEESRGVSVLCYADDRTFTGSGTLCELDAPLPASLEPGDYPLVVDAPNRTATVRNSHALSDTTGSAAPAHAVSNGLLRVRFAGTPNDTDGNGIDDAWETHYFGGLVGASHTTDFDHDGLSDYYEFLSRTDPTDARSCLRVVAIAPAPGSEHEGILLDWHSISGRTYRVERTMTLHSGNTFSPVSGSLPATPPRNRFQDVPPASSTHHAYRILLEP